MKKKSLILIAFLIVSVFLGTNVNAISDEKAAKLAEQCSVVIYNLKQVQRRDAKARVYLGGRYENISSKFITPFNVRLVENNLSTSSFVENQNSFILNRTTFMNDYINYQKGLEDLITIDCKTEPARFYEKLELVRKKREKVSEDVKRIRETIDNHVMLVKNVKEKM